MRITVGGLLLVVGAGAVGALAFLPSGIAPIQVDQYLAAAREKVNTSLGLFRSASTESAADVPLISSATVSPAVEAPLAETPPAAPVIPVAAVPEKPVVVAAPAPAVKKARAKRRSTRKKTAVKKTAAAKPAAKAAPAPVAKAAPKTGGSLVGQDVVLTLTSGREVRGVLQEQDSIAYKVELPGLGAFTYPVQNVKSVRAAE